MLSMLSIFVLANCENELSEYDNCTEIHEVVEKMPELIDGLANLQRKTVYPYEAIENPVYVRVFVDFVVLKTGDSCLHSASVSSYDTLAAGNIDISKFEQGAIALVANNASFNPGIQGGLPVCVSYSLPIAFRPEDE